MPLNQSSLETWIVGGRSLIKGGCTVGKTSSKKAAPKYQVVRKGTGPRDSHLYESKDSIGCGIHVLVGVLNGTIDTMGDDIASALCTREALRGKKKLTKAEMELLSLCKDTVKTRDVGLSPKSIKGAGRGKGMWVRHGPLHPAAYEEGSLRGLWSAAFEDVTLAYNGAFHVVLLVLEVWKTKNQGKPTLVSWRHEHVGEDSDDFPLEY